MTVAAIVQCTAGDVVNSIAADDYCIQKCLDSEYIDKIILACPDVEESSALEGLAKKWGVEIYRGSNLNVASRLLEAAQSVGATLAVRVLLRQFYLDVPQVERMIDSLKLQQADYVVLPNDYNYALAADVMSVKALAKTVKQISGIEDARKQSSYQFSPCVYMEEHPEQYKLLPIDGGPEYSFERSDEIRTKYHRLVSENQVHFDWKYPASSYGFMGKYIREADSVLDIACGKGEGVRRLREYCNQVIGVDLTPEHIEIARQKHGAVQGISYEVGDAETYVNEDAFDVITSIHTLEHLEEPDAFFRCSRKSLKIGGRLLLEVPLLLPFPMNMPLMPWHHKEYELQELVNLVKLHGFRVDEVWAKKRHAFVNIKLEDGVVTSEEGRLTAGIVIATKLEAED